MKVSEAVKNITNFVVTKKGEILAINNGNKLKLGSNSKITEKELMEMEVNKIQNIRGVIKDYSCIRI